MRGLKAAVAKDLRLFATGTGLVTLLLPVLLLLALSAGIGDSARQAYIQPFPIAVRDNDGTIMSRTVLEQLAQVELFSRIIIAETGESDRQLLEQGAAAAVTIPKDFFYTMYTMDNSPVEVTLNNRMPLESSVFSSIFRSVIDIVGVDQAAMRGVYSYCYGDLTPALEQRLWEDTSKHLFTDILYRQQIFDSSGSISDAAGGLERSLFACALSTLCFFFALAAVKTLPEELTSGVLPRFISAGGSLTAFFLSKFITALIPASLSLGLMLWVFRPSRWGAVLLLAGVLFAVVFLLLLWVAALSGSSAALQRWGNVILLLSLTAGGSIYATQLLPDWAQLLGRVTLPYYARRGLDTLGSGGSITRMLGDILPVIAMGVVFGLLGAARLSRSRSGGFDRINTGGAVGAVPATVADPTSAAVIPEAAPHSGWRRLVTLGLFKLRIMSGGWHGLAATAAVVFLCGWLAAGALGRQGPAKLTIAVCNEDSGSYGQALLTGLSRLESLTVHTVTQSQGEKLLSSGKAEGLLTINEDYSRGIAGGGQGLLSYSTAVSAVSAQAAREMVAGQAATQRAQLRGIAYGERLLGGELTETQRQELAAAMANQQRLGAPLYHIATHTGTPPQSDPFAPNQLGFAGLAVMVTLLTWGGWTAGRDSRRVELRFYSLPGGRWLSYGSDLLAMAMVGLLAGAAALLPGQADGRQWLAMAAYVLCVTGLAAALTRAAAGGGRVESFAPFVALITCMVGGCFGSIASFSPLLQKAALCTPQGLALEGGWQSLTMLLLAGLLLAVVGRPVKR